MIQAFGIPKIEIRKYGSEGFLKLSAFGHYPPNMSREFHH